MTGLGADRVKGLDARGVRQHQIQKDQVPGFFEQCCQSLLQGREAGDFEGGALFLAQADSQDIGELLVIFDEKNLQIGPRELFLDPSPPPLFRAGIFFRGTPLLAFKHPEGFFDHLKRSLNS
jgi:hypothetical protein